MENKPKGQNEQAHMVTEPEPNPQPQSQHQNEVNKNNDEDDDDGYETVYVADLDEYVSYYDWLGDTCATSHVTNQREAFKTFTPFDKKGSPRTRKPRNNCRRARSCSSQSKSE